MADLRSQLANLNSCLDEGTEAQEQAQSEILHLKEEREEHHCEMQMLREQLRATERVLEETKSMWAQTETEREYLETQVYPNGNE